MLEDYLFKKPTRWIFAGLIAVIAGLLIFDAGFEIGERRARPVLPPFSAYGVPLPHAYGDMGHGAVGQIESTNLPSSFVIETRGNEEETVLITSTTQLDPQGATSTVLKVGTRVVILGEPESTSSIQALLIRVPQQ